jgi:hypothetical protein
VSVELAVGDGNAGASVRDVEETVVAGIQFNIQPLFV